MEERLAHYYSKEVLVGFLFLVEAYTSALPLKELSLIRIWVKFKSDLCFGVVIT